MSELHILNGDYALELWKKCNYRSSSLVWRETYLDGPLPDTDDLHLFRQVRAKYLASFAELTDIGEDRLYKHLHNMDETVQDLPENSTVMLWFDSCIFDQTILMRILYLLQSRRNPSVTVYLYCCNSDCLCMDDFQYGINKKIHLDPQDLDIGRKAWCLFLNKDAAGMRQLAQQGNFEHLPAMQKALLRCAEEVPGDDGLNRTERQILQLVAGGCCSFEEIFKKLSDFEEYPFLGDTGCQRRLDYLTEKGLLSAKQGEYFLPHRG